MKLITFVRAECANLRRSDNCCWPDDRPCLVLDDATGGTRCGYFEKAVLPIAEQPSPRGQEVTRFRDGLQHDRQQAANEYKDNIDGK